MDSTNNRSTKNMAWVEVNKAIAEKQMTVVQGNSAIRAYKTQIDLLQTEGKLSEEQKQRKQLEYELIQKEIEYNNNAVESVKKIKVLLGWKNQMINEKLTEGEQNFLTEKEEWNKLKEKKAEEFNKLKESFFEKDPEYVEVRALEQKYEEMLQKNLSLLENNKTIKKVQKESLRAATDELNKVIVELAKQMVRLQRLRGLKCQVKDAQMKYTRINSEFLSKIFSTEINEQTTVEVNPSIRPALASIEIHKASNMCEEAIRSQTSTSLRKVSSQQSTSFREHSTNIQGSGYAATFKLPSIQKKRPQSSVQPKIQILENIIVPTSVMTFDSKQKSEIQTGNVAKMAKFDNEFVSTLPDFSVDPTFGSNNLFDQAQPNNADDKDPFLNFDYDGGFPSSSFQLAGDDFNPGEGSGSDRCDSPFSGVFKF